MWPPSGPYTTAPVGPEEITTMLERLRGAALLSGSSRNAPRGHGPARAGIGGMGVLKSLNSPKVSARPSTPLEVNPFAGWKGDCIEILDALVQVWRSEETQNE